MDNDDCLSGNCVDHICETESVPACSEAIAIDLGRDGHETTVPNDGCVMVKYQYPSWWGVRTMMLQTTSPGSYPVPFTWSNACTGDSGAGLFTGNWQNQFLSKTDKNCATLINLKGSGSGTVRLRYYGG